MAKSSLSPNLVNSFIGKHPYPPTSMVFMAVFKSRVESFQIGDRMYEPQNLKYPRKQRSRKYYRPLVVMCGNTATTPIPVQLRKSGSP